MRWPLLVLVLLVPAAAAAEPCSACYETVTFQSHGGLLDKTDVVYEAGSYRSKGWQHDGLAIDFGAGTIEGNVTLTTIARSRLVGTVDPDSYAIHARLEEGAWDQEWSTGYRRGAFTGTFEAPLYDYAYSDFLLDSQIEDAKEGQTVASSGIGWQGTLSVTWSEYEYHDDDGAADADAPPIGQAQTSTSSIFLSGTLTGSGGAQTLEARIERIRGDVEMQSAPGGEFVEAHVGDVVAIGGSVSTGYDSSALLRFPHGELTIGSLTNLGITDFLQTPEGLVKSQLYLRVGSVAAKIPHEASIRGDFSVRTPTCNSSIRGSEMVVSHNETSNVTTVFATEDAAFVQGLGDSLELEVTEGLRTTVGPSGLAEPPTAFSPDEVPEFPSFASRGGGAPSPGLGLVAASVLLAAVLRRR